MEPGNPTKVARAWAAWNASIRAADEAEAAARTEAEAEVGRDARATATDATSPAKEPEVAGAYRESGREPAHSSNGPMGWLRRNTSDRDNGGQ